MIGLRFHNVSRLRSALFFASPSIGQTSTGSAAFDALFFAIMPSSEKMEVYIELAFLQNLAIDGALLYATQSFLGYRISMRRILFAALVGAAFAIVYPLMSYPIAVGWVIKLFSGATICLIASAEKGFLRQFRSFAIFILFSAMLAGATYAMPFPGKLCAVILCFGVFWAAKRIKELFRKRLEIKRFVYDCALCVNGRELNVRGFLDTGNRIYHRGKPVFLLAGKTAGALFVDFSESGHTAYEKIILNTVNGRKETLVFEAEYLRIYSEKRVHTIEKAMIGLSASELSEDYELLLAPSCLYGDCK